MVEVSGMAAAGFASLIATLVVGAHVLVVGGE
jgi:hypothetical protein